MDVKKYGSDSTGCDACDYADSAYWEMVESMQQNHSGDATMDPYYEVPDRPTLSEQAGGEGRILPRDCDGGLSEQHGSASGVNLDERWTTTELTMAERRRSPEKDEITFARLNAIDAEIAGIMERNDLPYANDLYMRLSRVRQQLSDAMDSVNPSDD